MTALSVKTLLRHPRTKAAFGGALAALLGWQMAWQPLGEFLANSSFDLPFLFSERIVPPNVVLLELDEVSHTDLRQTYEAERWDRHLHARLLDHLRAEGASLVVFDIVFGDASPDAAADRDLARAIRACSQVLLAADLSDIRRNGIVGPRIIPPHELFRAATTNWAPPMVETGTDGVVRKLSPGTSQQRALAWLAATKIRDSALKIGDDPTSVRWVRYYGPGGTLPRLSYSEASNQPPGFFRDKAVFVGGRPKTEFVGKETDTFLTPWRLHGHPQISGLELLATEFLNLRRGDYLRRPQEIVEFALLAGLGVLAGIGLGVASPWRAGLLAVGGAFGVVTLAVVLFLSANLWFNWAVAALVEIPCALAWSLGWQWWKLKREKDWLEAPVPELWAERAADVSGVPASATGSPSSDQQAVPAGSPAIPDYELLRLVGRGAYGDVWLARDVLGQFRVLKVVRRAAFDDADPYDREFHGLQKFTPISRVHHGLIQILHVGRNSVEDFFYYVMEAGDDETTGLKIDPATYSPRNLGRDLRQRGPLSPAECVAILVPLSEALEFLHGLGLIHRDIKPANIIFVNGRPKLADVGLVTDMADSIRVVSNVGTEGYLPPEGPGTPAGDVFALGKVLGEMLRPRDPADSTPNTTAQSELRAIIDRACAANPAARFVSARELRDALVAAGEKIKARDLASSCANG